MDLVDVASGQDFDRSGARLLSGKESSFVLNNKVNAWVLAKILEIALQIWKIKTLQWEIHDLS